MPRSRFCRSALYWPTALAFLPGAKPTACTHRQPHLRVSLTWLKLTAGPLLRGIQAVLQELAGSATGGTGLGLAFLGRTARFARGYPPAAPLQKEVLGPLRSALVGLLLAGFLLGFLFFFLALFLESGYVFGCFLGNLLFIVVHRAAVCDAQNQNCHFALVDVADYPHVAHAVTPQGRKLSSETFSSRRRIVQDGYLFV